MNKLPQNRKAISSLLTYTMQNELIIIPPSVFGPGRPGGDPPVPLPWQRPPRLKERAFGQHRNLRLAERVRRLSQPL